MSEEAPKLPPTDLYDLVQDLDLNIPLSELVGDLALLEQPIEIEPEELERLDELAREYVQELIEQGWIIPDIPPMDSDPKLLEPTQEIDRDLDFGR